MSTHNNGTSASPYKRVVLKLSGEALAPEKGEFGIAPQNVDFIAQKVKAIFDLGLQLAVVIGGGNLWRGEIGVKRGMDQTTADHMGMIATVMNALALRDAFERNGMSARVQTAVHMNEVAEPYIRLRAIRHLEKGRVVIFAGGTGNPYFTTDTAAALRATEINADIVIKATKVNGVYDSDPRKNPNAVRFDQLSYQTALEKRLEIMDLTAFTLCQENKMPILIVNFWHEDDLLRAMQGDMAVGTLIS
jgi:uridylate kinase